MFCCFQSLFRHSIDFFRSCLGRVSSRRSKISAICWWYRRRRLSAGISSDYSTSVQIAIIPYFMSVWASSSCVRFFCLYDYRLFPYATGAGVSPFQNKRIPITSKKVGRIIRKTWTTKAVWWRSVHSLLLPAIMIAVSEELKRPFRPNFIYNVHLARPPIRKVFSFLCVIQRYSEISNIVNIAFEVFPSSFFLFTISPFPKYAKILCLPLPNSEWYELCPHSCHSVLQVMFLQLRLLIHR